MKTKWNRIGKIKALVLGLLALPNLLFPMGPTGRTTPTTILMPLIFASFLIPFLSKINAGSERQISKPFWNDNPFVFKRPFAMYNFAAYFFIVVGLSMLIGVAIKFRALNSFGLTSISLGIGMLVGIWLTLNILTTPSEKK